MDSRKCHSPLTEQHDLGQRGPHVLGAPLQPPPRSLWAGLTWPTTHLNSNIRACRKVRKLLCLLMLESSSRAIFPKTCNGEKAAGPSGARLRHQRVCVHARTCGPVLAPFQGSRVLVAAPCPPAWRLLGGSEQVGSTGNRGTQKQVSGALLRIRQDAF